MVAGGMDVILSTNYIPEKEWLDDQSLVKLALLFAPKTREHVFDPSYFQSTLNMMDEMEREMKKWNESEPKRKCILAKNVNELENALSAEDKPMVFIHSVEGAHSLQGNLAGKLEVGKDASESRVEILGNLEALAERGVAYLTLAHFYPNQCVHPVFPYPEYGIKKGNWEHLMEGWDMTKGLSELGEEVVGRMLDLEMIIDICHCTPVARKRIYEIAEGRGVKGGVISTHTGVFEINPNPYNLADWEIRWMADNGGCIGVIFMNYWLSPIDTGLGMKYIERTINHLITVGGENVAAIGTDFDGFTDPPDEMVDVSQMPRLTRYLVALGYSDEVIGKVLGGNAMSTLKRGWA
tara:strand:+ start:14048 stop:15100 length:1053 start_codon:yes stop_codon:yes gene_type:complete